MRSSQEVFQAREGIFVTNYISGHDAEKLAATYLKNKGFKVTELNWKTRLCEIDIVAKKDKIIWFVEVKSRKDSLQGYGYEDVTGKELRRVRFSAEVWVAENKWDGDYRLAVVSVDGAEVTLYDDI